MRRDQLLTRRQAGAADALARALSWYANPKNWKNDDWGVASVIQGSDYGKPGERARNALKRIGYGHLVRPRPESLRRSPTRRIPAHPSPSRGLHRGGRD